MTPRKYTQSASLIQWAYLFEEVKPLKTSTCALFWRSVLMTPIKILGQLLILAVFLAGVFTIAADAISPTWTHATLPWAGSEHIEPRPFPWVWLITIIGSVLLVVWGGEKLGLWSWLHSFCLPVEIEGGLVRKGSCPQCASTMFEYEEGDWKCCRCGGYFVPPQSVAAVDPQVGASSK